MNEILEDDQEQRLPSQKELEKELSDYLSKKYGDRIKIVSPLLFPQSEASGKEEGKSGLKEGKTPSFDMKPEELESYLDTYVVKQDQAKGVLATKICTHFNRIRASSKEGKKEDPFSVGTIKNNILMIGPTGVGKTYLVKLIAQKIGVPFIKADATKFSETGYVGGDIEDLIRDLVYEADNDIELAENGIVYVDEIDKIASSQNNIGHDISRTGVQRALLKLMEDTEVDLKVPHDPISQIQAIEHYRRTGKREKQVVNTKNILFVMSGAFEGLADIIKKRLKRQGIGFEADIHPAEVGREIYKQVRPQDLIEYGFEYEFIGRLPVIVVLDELTKEDLMTILNNPNNPIILSKKRDFMAYGIGIQFEAETLEKLAEKASEEKTGARGLVSAGERSLMPFEKHLPSTDLKRLLVKPELIDDPELELKNLESADVAQSQEMNARFESAVNHEKQRIRDAIRNRSREFEVQSYLELNEEGIDLIADQTIKSMSDINSGLLEFKRKYDQVIENNKELFSKLGINVSLDGDAVYEIIRLSITQDRDVNEICSSFATELEYGLKLVRDRIGRENFVLTREAVVAPEKYIDNLIKECYNE